jgi:hypothetical protein
VGTAGVGVGTGAARVIDSVNAVNMEFLLGTRLRRGEYGVTIRRRTPAAGLRLF